MSDERRPVSDDVDLFSALAPSGYRRVVEMLLRGDALNVVASEFVFASDIAAALPKAGPATTKLGRLVQRMERSLADGEQAYDDWGAPPEMMRALIILRDELAQRTMVERVRLLRRAVEREDPPFLDEISV